MNISADVLKVLYQQSLNPVNINGIGINGVSDSAGIDNSFLRILNEVISKNNSSNLIVSNSEDEKEPSNNEISHAISLLLQQITGNNPTEQYENVQNVQNVLIDQIDEIDEIDEIDDILNTLQNSDRLGVEALTGITENLSLDSSVSNIDKLIESLQELKQSNSKDTQENIVDATYSQSSVNTQTKVNKSFPKEIIDSINAARQAHELIRARIDQIRDFKGRANVGQVNNLNNLNSLNNIEELLVKGLTYADLQNLKVSLISTDDLSNLSIADSKINTEEIGRTGQSLLSTELLSAEVGLQKTEENSSTSKEKSRFDVIDESILNTNKANTSEAQTDNKLSKIGNDFAAVKESVFEQIKDQVSMMRAGEKQAVTMHLKPEELGKLDIRMVLEKGNLSIEIHTSNDKAHSLILSSIPELESVLKNSISSDRNFMNFENAKQLSEENARQNNQGYNGQNSEQQEQNNNRNRHEEFYTTGSEDSEKLDFYTAFSRIQEARTQISSKT